MKEVKKHWTVLRGKAGWIILFKGMPRLP